MRGLGYLPDPEDSRDRLHDALGLATTPPPSASLERWMAPIPNQLNTSSCVGQAMRMGFAVEESSAAAAITAPTSALGHYFNARAQNGVEHEDVGTWLRSAFKALKYFGPLREDDWPFDASKVNVRPRWRAYQNAFDARGDHGYYRIYGDGDTRLDAIRRAVASGHPVLFGTQVAESFLPDSGPPLIDVPRGENIAGGHAMCVVAYEPTRFLVANSWGGAWREAGCAWLTENYLAWEDTRDIWVLSLG